MGKKGNDPRVRKERAETMYELNETLDRLRTQCEQWELGKYENSGAIAVSPYTLLYDYNKSAESIFTQLGWRDAHPFFTTPNICTLPAGKFRMLARFGSSSVMITPDKKIEGTPSSSWTPEYFYGGIPLSERDSLSSLVPRWDTSRFKTWWNEAILHDHNTKISRGNLINYLRNDLGAGHSPRLMDPTAAAMRRNEPIGISDCKIIIEGVELPNKNAMYDASVRQIAYEVQRTIEHYHRTEVDRSSPVPPFPRQWRSDGHCVRVLKQDPIYLSKILDDIEKIGEGDSVGAVELRAELYWHDYSENLRLLGL